MSRENNKEINFFGKVSSKLLLLLQETEMWDMEWGLGK
jgi:hypothetical protein